MRAWRWLPAGLLAGVLATTALGVVPQATARPRAQAPTSTAAVAAPAAASPRRPNVVLVMMDDMRWDELRFAPTVRRHITDRGLRFANSFSPLPLCCPARASFLLGQYAHNHKVLQVSKPFGFGSLDDRRTIATSMHARGYHTALVGKYLNGYGRMTSKVTGGSSLRYKPAGWTDWMASVEKRWPATSRFRGGTYNYRSFTQNVNRRVVSNRGKYSSNVIADEAVGLVRKYHRSKAPFFLWLTPVAPHHGGPTEARDPKNYRKTNGFVQQFPTPYVPAALRGRFDRSVTHAPGVPVSHAAEPDLSDKPPSYRRFLENTRTEKLRLRDVERQRAEAIYAWDAQFAKVIRELRRTGEYADTVLVFTSDNGYYMGEHRHPAGKITHHEVSSRVPLVVAGPRVQRGVRYTPAMTHDLTATILDLAGAAPLPRMDGTSLWPVITGPDRPWTRPVLLEARTSTPHTSPGFPSDLSEFGVRSGRYKYVRYANGAEELYDLTADPNELTGLQRDPAHAGLKSRMVALWEQYVGCRAAACTAPLPDDLHVDVPTLRAQESIARRAQVSYYDR